MVGKKTKIKDFVKKWLNKPYELGKYDCLQLIKDFYDLPDKWKNIDIKKGEYKKLWIEKRNKGKELYMDFIDDYFELSDNLFIGDLIISKTNFLFIVGIYIGNNRILTFVEDKGCIIMPIFFDFYIYKRRWEV